MPFPPIVHVPAQRQAQASYVRGWQSERPVVETARSLPGELYMCQVSQPPRDAWHYFQTALSARIIRKNGDPRFPRRQNESWQHLGTPSQSAQVPYSRVSSTSVSPTSNTTASITATPYRLLRSSPSRAVTLAEFRSMGSRRRASAPRRAAVRPCRSSLARGRAARQ